MPRIIFCEFLCSWISNNAVQITRKSVCRQIRNVFFTTPVDMLNVLRLRARCSQAMSNLLILDILYFPANPAHSTMPPTHLIRVPKEGLLHVHVFSVWVACQNMPTSKRFWRDMAFLVWPHSLGGFARRKPPTFLHDFLKCYEPGIMSNCC